MADLLDLLRSALEGRYAIERLIGEGGMATVYLARDGRHERAVAIKVLRPELAASIGADRFLREIKVAAQLQHPNILPLYDSHTAGVDEIPLFSRLSVLYVGIFLSAEIAFILMALKEYAKEAMGLTERDLMLGSECGSGP